MFEPLKYIVSHYPELYSWLYEIIPWGQEGNIGERYIQFSGEENDGSGPMIKVCLYTKEHYYPIHARRATDDNAGYLGAYVQNRKPRAGEDWTRGNDLPDGPYTKQTWEKIKDAIIKYELVRLASRQQKVPGAHLPGSEVTDIVPGEKQDVG